MTTDYVRLLADRLDRAQTSRSETDSIQAEGNPRFDVGVAYDVQEELLARRQSRGETQIGVKLGFTSRAKMAQMGVSDVIVGRLTDTMQIPNGGTLNLSHFIHPKVEPEVAYRICRDVDLTDATLDLTDHVDAVAPAVEVIDSRYRSFKFTYADVIADNTSAAAFAVGDWTPFRAAAGSAVRLGVGEHDVVGSTSAILDDPINALHALLEMCRTHRIALREGYIVLAGAATAAIPLEEGEVTCSVDGFGSVAFTVANSRGGEG